MLDVYVPGAALDTAQQGRGVPGVLYLHGGAWRSGDKSEVSVWAGLLVSQGYVVASANYRLAPQHKWPAQIEDAKCALRYLRANASTYNLDPLRVGVMGSSAGGHLAALLGLTGPEAGLDGTGGHPEQSTSVQAVVDLFGPANLLGYDLQGYRQDVEAMLGVPLEQATDILRRASPVTYVSANAPPFLIIQGDKDTVVPPAQSQELYDRLVAAGASATLLMVKNAGHGFAPVGGPISPDIAEIGSAILSFLHRNLRDMPVDGRYFPETGKTVRGRFLEYWQQNGGLAQQGYPISEEMQEVSEINGKTYTVQYFERAVFELHPQNRPPYDVLLSQLGTLRYREKYPAGVPGQMPHAGADSVFFPQTGKHLGGRFLEYWQQNGGLAQQGYPISDEFVEISELDGKPYTVQYFERAVFELHPQNHPPYDVLLSQLGTLRYKARYAGEGGGR
jgi:acetyl esterase/lipase